MDEEPEQDAHRKLHKLTDQPDMDLHLRLDEPLRDRWRLYALTPAAGWGWC